MQLSPNTAIYQAHQGFVLRTADDEHFELTLDGDEVHELLSVLSGDGSSASSRVRAALSALVDAGHVVTTVARPTVTVRGQGKIASATSKRLGARVSGESASADVVCHVSDDPVDPAQIGAVDLASYRDGIIQVITPQAVGVADVVGRRRACAIHRDRMQSHHRPVDGGLRLESTLHPVSDRAADVIADLIVTEIDDRQGRSITESPTSRSQHLLTTVDLRTLRIVRRPVLPIPAVPQ
ncbi:hypothetical protein DFJ75_0573 [Williamsia muralis]|uniref:Uncharacterized protein n=1 Tax=Williamsia marianensis TaxID=85044 RepID=A0A495JXN0_WILMA|nr:hypothetical protein [Williamsia muralis]RKR93786.1 hypothetical protein DFJ75_0573 [Williamsia muralis]